MKTEDYAQLREDVLERSRYHVTCPRAGIPLLPTKIIDEVLYRHKPVLHIDDDVRMQLIADIVKAVATGVTG